MIKLAIINITTFVGMSFDADHYYGHIIFSELSIEPGKASEWSMNSLGKSQELSYELTLKDAKALDKKDHHDSYQYSWHHGDKMCTRFNTPEDVIEAGIKIWREKMKEVGYEFPLINLYEGEKYEDTKILKK